MNASMPDEICQEDKHPSIKLSTTMQHMLCCPICNSNLEIGKKSDCILSDKELIKLYKGAM